MRYLPLRLHCACQPAVQSEANNLAKVAAVHPTVRQSLYDVCEPHTHTQYPCTLAFPSITLNYRVDEMWVSFSALADINFLEDYGER